MLSIVWLYEKIKISIFIKNYHKSWNPNVPACHKEIRFI